MGCLFRGWLLQTDEHVLTKEASLRLYHAVWQNFCHFCRECAVSSLVRIDRDEVLCYFPPILIVSMVELLAVI